MENAFLVPGVYGQCSVVNVYMFGWALPVLGQAGGPCLSLDSYHPIRMPLSISVEDSVLLENPKGTVLPAGEPTKFARAAVARPVTELMAGE